MIKDPAFIILLYYPLILLNIYITHFGVHYTLRTLLISSMLSKDEVALPA